MKKIINLFVIFIFLTFVLLSTSCSEETSVDKKNFQNLLEGFEISSLVEFNGSVYAGGLEGVFKINTENLNYEKMEIGDVFLVKDLLVFNDELYIGHEEGIKVYRDGKYKEILNKDFKVKDVRINDLYIDEGGNLWAGTYGGVLKLNKGKWESLSTDEGLMDDTVFLIIDDGLGGMVFGHYASSDSGLSYVKNGKWNYYNTDNGLPHNYITDGMRIGNKLYITTGFFDVGGVAIFDVTKEGIKHDRNIIEEWGDYGSKARSIGFREEELWIGTEYNGLSIIKSGNIYNFNEENGLINNEVKSILFREEGKVWLGTRSGVSVIEADELLN